MVSIMIFLIKKVYFSNFCSALNGPAWILMFGGGLGWMPIRRVREKGEERRDELALKRVNQPRNPLARLSRVLIGGHPNFPDSHTDISQEIPLIFV